MVARYTVTKIGRGEQRYTFSLILRLDDDYGHKLGIVLKHDGDTLASFGRKVITDYLDFRYEEIRQELGLLKK